MPEHHVAGLWDEAVDRREKAGADAPPNVDVNQIVRAAYKKSGRGKLLQKALALALRQQARRAIRR